MNRSPSGNSGSYRESTWIYFSTSGSNHLLLCGWTTSTSEKPFLICVSLCVWYLTVYVYVYYAKSGKILDELMLSFHHHLFLFQEVPESLCSSWDTVCDSYVNNIKTVMQQLRLQRMFSLHHLSSVRSAINRHLVCKIYQFLIKIHNHSFTNRHFYVKCYLLYISSY